MFRNNNTKLIRTWRRGIHLEIDWSCSIPGIEIGDFKFSTDTMDKNGWLLCDGRSLSREYFSDLYSKIGTAFGNSCGNTFLLPDCKGRVMAAINGCQRSLGFYTGSEEHTLSIDEMPSHVHTGNTVASGQHNHGVSDPGHVHSQTTNNDDFSSTGGDPPSFAADAGGDRSWNNISRSVTGISINADGSHSHAFTTALTGNGQAHNNMQPTVFIGNVFVFSGTRRPVVQEFPIT